MNSPLSNPSLSVTIHSSLMGLQHLHDNPSESTKLRDLLELSFSFNTFASTHEMGHTLDLIITRSSDQILSSDPKADELSSDHFSISYSLFLVKPHLKAKEITIRPKNQGYYISIENSISFNNVKRY